MTEHRSRQALRPSVGEMVSLNITDEVTRLKAKPEWSSEDRLAVSLVKDDALNILLMVLKEGARLAEHRTKGPIAVQVLTGSVRFSAGSEQTALSAGHMAALDRNVVHSLEALEESVILLTTSIS
jgi:quercetin dioxygenase-like cupin family protein